MRSRWWWSEVETGPVWSEDDELLRGGWCCRAVSPRFGGSDWGIVFSETRKQDNQGLDNINTEDI